MMRPQALQKSKRRSLSNRSNGSQQSISSIAPQSPNDTQMIKKTTTPTKTVVKPEENEKNLPSTLDEYMQKVETGTPKF